MRSSVWPINEDLNKTNLTTNEQRSRRNVWHVVRFFESREKSLEAIEKSVSRSRDVDDEMSDDKINQLVRKLTVQRIGLRQAHALSAVRARRHEFETYNSNRKNRSNANGARNSVGYSFMTGVVN